jgi:hypothetical protein
MENLGRLLVIFGLVLVAVGGLIYLASRLNLPLGHLPGDIRVQTGNITCFFPLATMILLSILLTVGLNLIIRLLNK